MAIFECIQSYQTQRRLRLVISVTAFASLVLSFLSIYRCTFMLSGEISDPNAKMYAFGLLTTPVYDQEHRIQGCIAYPSSIELGPSMKTAQAFGIILVVFQSAVFLGLVMVQFFLEHGTSTIYHIIRVLLPSSFVCQLLTFTAFASKFCSEIKDELDEQGGMLPATCLPGGAGVVGIFNLVAIILMTTLMNMVKPPEHPVFQLYGTGNSVVQVRKSSTSKRASHSRKSPSSYHQKPKRQKEMETYSYREPQRPGKEKIKTTIINGPDVRKTIKQIIHPDGSQTITTTIEELLLSHEEEEEDTVESDDSTVLEVV